MVPRYGYGLNSRSGTQTQYSNGGGVRKPSGTTQFMQCSMFCFQGENVKEEGKEN